MIQSALMIVRGRYTRKSSGFQLVFKGMLGCDQTQHNNQTPTVAAGGAHLILIADHTLGRSQNLASIPLHVIKHSARGQTTSVASGGHMMYIREL